jgi:hypothetical protein
MARPICSRFNLIVSATLSRAYPPIWARFSIVAVDVGVAPNRSFGVAKPSLSWKISFADSGGDAAHPACRAHRPQSRSGWR